MAPSNNVEAAAIDGDLAVKPPADVVIPPKGIREVVHKTADWLNRRPPAMEDNLRDRSTGKANLSFLYPEDAYYGYFQWFKQQLKEGKDPASGAQSGQGARDSKPKGPVEPAKFRFSARMPNINAKDLEILKLTALYTAKNGENWLKELRNRESGSYQFEFLRVTHTFFGYFRALIDQYKILIEEEQTVEARIEELQRNIKNRFNVLDRAKQRAEFNKYRSQEKEKEDQKAEDDRKELQAIDWQDFTVIATVTFDESDEAVELPPPTSMNDLQSASLEQKAAVSLNNRIEEAAPDDVTYYNVSHHGQNPAAIPAYPTASPFAPPVQPMYQPSPPLPQDYRTPAQRARDEEEERAVLEREAERERAARAQAAAKGAPATMRIRTDYVPRAVAKKTNVPMALCPNCKQKFPADELEDHIRIELLDPRWKEQREKSDIRHASTINTAEVANNLKRFASMRDDIYDGVTGMPISEEEVLRRKKAAVSYDGQPDPAKDAARLQEMQNLNVQEQLRRIQERHGGK